MLALSLLSGCALTSAGPGEPLELQSLTREGTDAPKAAASVIRWRVAARGGTGELRYEFRSRQGSAEIVEQVGASPTWDWRPLDPGAYHVRAAVIDGAGDRVESAWQPEIVVAPVLRGGARVAILPVENLSGRGAPTDLVAELLHRKLGERGLDLLDHDDLEYFMKRHRVRNTSGLSSSVASTIRDEVGVDAVLITSLEAYREPKPATAAVISRLVSTGERPEIIWMDGIGLKGDGYPGFLNRNLVEDPITLLENAIECLADSLALSLWIAPDGSQTHSVNLQHACNSRGDVAAASAERRVKRRHRPQTLFRSPEVSSERRYTVAVIPFLNLSDRKHAGSIVTLHFVSQLLRARNFAVVEPGLVREQLLKYRIIMEAGPSLANAEIISSEGSLDVDLVCSGTVFDYQDGAGTPKVDFSTQIIDAPSRDVVWSSRSNGNGDEGVVFWDFGRVRSTHRLASELARGTFDALRR